MVLWDSTHTFLAVLIAFLAVGLAFLAARDLWRQRKP